VKAQRLFYAWISAALGAACLCAGQEQPPLTAGEAVIRKYLPAAEYDLTTLALWPQGAPDEPRTFPEESVGEGRRGSYVQFVSQPSLTVARPKRLTEPAPAVFVCPGGGYGSLGIDTGGVDILAWLGERGIAGVYMKYRVPKRGKDYEMHHQPLQDMQRAVSLLRQQAKQLRIDPERIGAIGFSAGGNLVAMLSLYHRPEDRLYQEIDATDKFSCRADFVAMVAPAYLTQPIVSDQLMPAVKPEKIQRNITPPTFITSAVSDKFTVGALHYFLLLREKRVPAELHVYEKGGHAEGIHEGVDNQWPLQYEDWLRRLGVIGKEEAAAKR
jgi:acetyl esterase/lipase